MKTIKKLLIVGLVCILGSIGAIQLYAAGTGTFYSSWSYIGTSTRYRGVADFTGGAYVLGTAGFEVVNGSIVGVTEQNNVTSVTVKGTLNAPSNLGVSVSKTVYPN